MRLLPAILLLLIAPASLAADYRDYWYFCQRAQQKAQEPAHAVTVTYAQQGQGAPCAVHYLRGKDREKLWSATVKRDYCEARAAELASQLHDWGWRCEQREGAPPATR